MVYLRSCSAETLAELDLEFSENTSNPLMGAQEDVVLLKKVKDGEAVEKVNKSNLEEYLGRLAKHRLETSISKQASAFREGLDVFVSEETRETMRQCFTPHDFQLIMSGVKEVDVDEWRKETCYGDGMADDTAIVRWFWKAVERMDNAERSALLRFCTGSLRVPLGGFANLLG